MRAHGPAPCKIVQWRRSWHYFELSGESSAVPASSHHSHLLAFTLALLYLKELFALLKKNSMHGCQAVVAVIIFKAIVTGQKEGERESKCRRYALTGTTTPSPDNSRTFHDRRHCTTLQLAWPHTERDSTHLKQTYKPDTIKNLTLPSSCH